MTSNKNVDTWAQHAARFNRLIEAAGAAPAGTAKAAIFVNDTLELAWASARNIFGDEATPEIALAIYDRLNTERLRANGDE